LSEVLGSEEEKEFVEDPLLKVKGVTSRRRLLFNREHSHRAAPHSLRERGREGGLKADEAEEVKEAIVKGLPKEEAVKLEEETAKKKGAATPKPAPKPEKKLEGETGEIACPKCGAKAKVYWHSKKVEWRET